MYCRNVNAIHMKHAKTYRADILLWRLGWTFVVDVVKWCSAASSCWRPGWISQQQMCKDGRWACSVFWSVSVYAGGFVSAWGLNVWFPLMKTCQKPLMNNSEREMLKCGDLFWRGLTHNLTTFLLWAIRWFTLMFKVPEFRGGFVVSSDKSHKNNEFPFSSSSSCEQTRWKLINV